MSLSTIEKLTEREQEVAQLLIMGLHTGEIGKKLNISKHTAKSHISAIIAKLRATNRTHAAYLFGMQNFYETIIPLLRKIQNSCKFNKEIHEIYFKAFEEEVSEDKEFENIILINNLVIESNKNIVNLIDNMVVEMDKAFCQ